MHVDGLNLRLVNCVRVFICSVLFGVEALTGWKQFRATSAYGGAKRGGKCCVHVFRSRSVLECSWPDCIIQILTSAMSKIVLEVSYLHRAVILTR